MDLFYTILRDPNLTIPLLFDLAFGFLFCFFIQRTFWRFFIWISVPFLVATIDVGFHVYKFVNDPEVQEDWLIFGILFIFGLGLCAGAIGIMLAHFFGREIKNRS